MMQPRVCAPPADNEWCVRAGWRASSNRAPALCSLLRQRVVVRAGLLAAVDAVRGSSLESFLQRQRLFLLARHVERAPPHALLLAALAVPHLPLHQQAQ